MKRFFNSLQNRILVCVLIIGVLPLIAIHLLINNAIESNLIEKRTSEVRQKMTVLATSVGQNLQENAEIPSDIKNILSWNAEAYSGRLLIIDRYYRIQYDSYSADTGKYCVSDAVFNAFGGHNYDRYNKDSETIDFVLPIIQTENNNKTVVSAMVFSMSTISLSDAIDSIKQLMLIIDVILGGLMIVIAIYLSYFMMRPIKRVEIQASKINEGNLATSLSSLKSYTEVDNIIKTSAKVVKHYQELERTQEEFVSNVSHELRTPMTSIRVLADSLIGQQNFPEEVYQEFLSDISTEIDRESRIIDDLLSMSKLDRGTQKLNLATISINDMILGILKTVKPLAEKQHVELVYESFRNVTADVDEVKLIQAFSNLVENGIKYNSENGQVRVSLDSDHEYFYVRITDTGVGIPKEALDHIFDRFYRVDKARSRETGGTGLGLPISKQLILLHDGGIRVDSVENEGTTFTVRIPLKHVVEGGQKK